MQEELPNPAPSSLNHEAHEGKGTKSTKTKRIDHEGAAVVIHYSITPILQQVHHHEKRANPESFLEEWYEHA